MKSDLIGGAIAVSAAFLSIFGVNVQKYSHDKEETRPKPRPYFERPVWWLGMICVVAASLGDFMSLGFASQTLVASLGGGSTIIGNALLSHFWLKQSLYITDVIGLVLVTLGVVTLAAASSPEEPHYSMDQLFKLMQAVPFLIYIFLTTAFVMTLLMRVRRSKAPALRVAASSTVPEDAKPSVADASAVSKPSSTDDSSSSSSSSDDATVVNVASVQANRSVMMSPFPSPVVGNVLSLSPTQFSDDGDDALQDPVLTSTAIPLATKSRRPEGQIEKQTLIIDVNLPLYWAAVSGTLGAQSMLLAKCVAEMISSTISGNNQFAYFGTYLLIGGLVATTLTQTHTLNLATMSGDTMSAYPVFQAFWISMSNISGVVFFQQAHSFTSTQWLLFPTAIMLVLLGIYLVSKHEKFGHRVKYSVAMPISLSSPRQHDIVAQSFVFRVLTPQRLQNDDEDDCEYGDVTLADISSPQRRRPSVDTSAV